MNLQTWTVRLLDIQPRGPPVVTMQTLSQNQPPLAKETFSSKCRVIRLLLVSVKKTNFLRNSVVEIKQLKETFSSKRREASLLLDYMKKLRSLDLAI